MLFQFEVFQECQDSWKAIIVDEFQDTSAMQYSLLQILASHNCITIVGDDDQAWECVCVCVCVYLWIILREVEAFPSAHFNLIKFLS